MYSNCGQHYVVLAGDWDRELWLSTRIISELIAQAHYINTRGTTKLCILYMPWDIYMYLTTSVITWWRRSIVT